MALMMRLLNATTATQINFSPSEGYSIPNLFKEVRLRSLSGKEYIYSFYSINRWEIPVLYLLKAYATQVNSWRASRATLRFYPDYQHASTTYNIVRIMNAEQPFNEMVGYDWDKRYNGEIILEGI